MATNSIVGECATSARSNADYSMSRAVANSPLLISFGQAITPEDEFEHARLFDQIAERRDHPFHRILLRDPTRSGYYRGVPGLGQSIDEVVASLRLLISELAPSQVVAFGSGLGGHAALVYGILVGVHRIVAINPPAHLIAGDLILHNDRRWHAQLSGFPNAELASRHNVATLASQIGFKGRAFILFGTQNENKHADAVPLDVLHAHWIARAEGMTLCPYLDHPGNLVDPCFQGESAEDILGRFFFDNQVPDSAMTTSTSTSSEDSARGNGPLQHYHFDVTLLPIDPKDLATTGGDSLAFATAGKLDLAPKRNIDDGWRRWIAENLMLGGSTNNIEATLVASGISQEDASAEIRDALQSPYFWGTQRLCNRLKKYDWLLTTYRKLNRLRPKAAQLESRRRLPRAEFLQSFYTPCRPVIITGMIDEWPALKRWSFEDILQRFGDRIVEVENDPSPDPKAASPLSLGKRFAWMRNAEPERNLVLSIGDGPTNEAMLSELWNDVGPIPEYLSERRDPPRRLRLGDERSVLPLHHSLCNVLHAQVVGQARVRVIPSWDLPLMRNLRSATSELDGRTVPITPLSALNQPQILEGVLSPGDLLFLPVGAWLFVEGLEAFAALSLTHFVFDNDFAAIFPNDQSV